jgi:hypothetical protein
MALSTGTTTHHRASSGPQCRAGADSWRIGGGPGAGALLASVSPLHLARLRARCLRNRQGLCLLLHLHFFPGLARLGRGSGHAQSGPSLPARSLLRASARSCPRAVPPCSPICEAARIARSACSSTTSLITLWSASGVIISWMDGFRRAYQLPKTWGIGAGAPDFDVAGL